MANNPYVNKVVYNDSSLIDLTEDTVTPESLLSGYTAHDRSGAPINGTAVIPTKISDLQDDVGYLVENDIVNDLTSTSTNVPLSAAQGKALNEKFGYWTVSDTNTLTASYVTYNTRSGRKFSDYDMLAITPDFGGWWTNGLVIPLSNFIGASGVALFYYDGSNRIEIDVKYQSDTSFQAKYIGNPTSNIHVNIFGFMPT